MKKLISILSICLVCLFAVSPLTTYAITPIDPLKDSSLTICYQHNDRPYEGLKVRTYRIAEVFADGTYALTGSFKDYPVSIYAVTSQSEWKQIASTLEAYAIADQLPPTRIGVTDAKGCVAFTDILPGMYLTMAIRVERETDITLFECFLSVVPYPSEDGAHDYDVEVYPKCQTITPTPQEKEYKVVKQWKDNGFVEKRPDNVKVDIYKDGVLQSTQEL
ncbi:MAG: hypothetical protein IJ955_04080, partial [Oscillospiraceae bacterium]|nr:hypothetical protein [Oscillospiraceae bacterium]